MIIAIGGGEVALNETYEIDKFIVESSKKKNQIFYSFRQRVKMLRLMLQLLINYMGSWDAKLTPCIYQTQK